MNNRGRSDSSPRMIFFGKLGDYNKCTIMWESLIFIFTGLTLDYFNFLHKEIEHLGKI